MISDRARKITKTTLNVLLLVGAAAIIAQNVSLIAANRALHKIDDKITAQIQSGQKLSSDLVAAGADGRLTPIPLPASADEHLLIITFSPGCPACQANREEWTKLSGALEQHGWHVLWVSRDRMEESFDYSRKHQIPLSDVLADPPYRTYVQLGLSRVPNTLVVGPGGIIQKVWPGQMGNAKWKEVFGYFNIEEEGTLSSAVAAR
jgi:peroxiredoxin